MADVWRLDPDIEPEAVGVDSGVLDEMVRAFESGLARGDLCSGAQMAMFRKGKRVLDVGGGIARRRTGEDVKPDTMFVIFSSTKGLAALVMLMLYERGSFHYDEPVVKYWPEFAREVPEKRSITIRQVMGHRGGFPTGPSWLTARYWPDRAAVRRAMEEVPLRWTPGEKNGYHAMNFGHVVNELVERIDGRDLGQYLLDEIAAPLGLSDVFVGLPDDPALEARVAWVEAATAGLSAAEAAGVGSGTGRQTEGAPASSASSPATPPREPQPRQERELDPKHTATPELSEPFNRPAIHQSVLPAGGGIATARDLAHVYAALALGGTLDDVSLVTPAGLAHCTTPTTRPGEVDETLRFQMRWGTGWHMGGYGKGSSARTFGHGGRGGQAGFADPDREMSFGFTTTGQLVPAEYTRWRTELQSLAFAACKT